jgi:truncated hemoglobin YjbI
MPFKIGQSERDAWVKNMSAALDAVPEFEPHKRHLQEFFENFATFLINQPT